MKSVSEPLRMTWKAVETWWEGWFGMVLFGLVWLLCWVTVVLGPPATFGFFHAVRWWMVERETNWNQYYRMARKHFFTSWVWFLVNLIVLILVLINYNFYGDLENSFGGLLQTITMLFGFLWIAVQFYALPYYVLLEKKSLIIAWKNGLFTILAAPIFSIVVWVILILVIYIHVSVLPFLFGGPGLIVTLSSTAVEDRIQKFGIRERGANHETETEN